MNQAPEAPKIPRETFITTFMSAGFRFALNPASQKLAKLRYWRVSNL